MGLHCFERLENNDCLFHSLIYQLKTLRVLILLSQGLINTHEFGLRCLHISSPWLISCNCNQLLPCQWGHCFKYNSHLGLFVIIRFELVLVLCTRTSFKSNNHRILGVYLVQKLETGSFGPGVPIRSSRNRKAKAACAQLQEFLSEAAEIGNPRPHAQNSRTVRDALNDFHTIHSQSWSQETNTLWKKCFYWTIFFLGNNGHSVPPEWPLHCASTDDGGKVGPFWPSDICPSPSISSLRPLLLLFFFFFLCFSSLSLSVKTFCLFVFLLFFLFIR